LAHQFSIAEKPTWKRTFYPIWLGQAFSLLGSRLVSFALIWHLTDLTERGVVLATAALVGLVPELLLMPLAGACVDRWNRRRILILSDGIIALATLLLAILVFLDSITIWQIFVLMAIRSIAGAFHNPAMKASTTLLVPRERYTNIAGLNQLLDSLLEISTPAVGAIFLALLGVGGVLLIDVATAVIAIVPLLFVQIPQPENHITHATNNPFTSLFKDMVEGFQYVVEWKGLLLAFSLATLSNALILPAIYLLPLLVKRGFGLDVDFLAAIQTTMGIAMAAGAAIMTVWSGFKLRMLTMSIGIAVMGGGLLLFGLASANHAYLVFIGAAIFAFANPFHNAPMRSILQENIEPEMQGRVFALLITAAKAATPIGMIISGPLADRLNVQIWFIMAAVYCIFMGIALMAIPATRNLEYGKPTSA
jgi:DHA3 family macrolide efflux protein-like MFS transporter